MDQGTIKIRTGFLFLQFTLLFFKPMISIDGGEEQKHPWGESTHEVAAGDHTVNVEITYLFGWRVSKASQMVSVAPRQTLTLSYRPPILWTWPGKLKVVSSFTRGGGPSLRDYASVAYEMLGFMGDDVRGGASALKERREPRFKR
ncbi:MAG: hypothetical protein ACTHQQ_17375 [Solirubrobacteraceae bacterium]